MNSPSRLLIVDDEASNFEVLEILLFREGFETHYAASGQEALDRMDEVKPDVVLLDVMMPGMDGIAVAQQLKSNPHWQHIPILMVTALDTKQDLARCLEAGADDFISKPVDGLELRARVRSMLRIRQQYERLQSLLQLREDMVDAIVHDLRNPLTNVTLASEMLRTTEPSSRQSRYIGQISGACQRLASMIDSLLVMARMQTGQLEVHRGPVDMVEIGQRVVQTLSAIAEQKHVTLLTRLPDQGHLSQIDGPLIERVLTNLLDNAIKYTPCHTSVELHLEYLTGGTVQFQIVDHGPGIAPALRQDVFGKYNIGQAIEGVAQIGIGLAFCKIAVEAHNGSICITDNVPQGSVFTVTLPTQTSSEAASVPLAVPVKVLTSQEH